MKGRQRDENVVRRRNPRELHLRREGENLTIGRSREVRDEIRDGCEIEIAEDRMKEEGEAVVEIEVAQDGTKEEGEVVIEIKLLESVLEVGDRGYTSRQEQSPFFKLPFEIRRQIYQDILGGYVIHIRFLEAYRKMAHSRCNIRHPKTCTRDWCRKNYKQEGASDPWKVKGLLDMLLSCRMM